MATGINEIQSNNGMYVDSSLPILCVLLAFIGVGIASIAIQQYHINKLYGDYSDGQSYSCCSYFPRWIGSNCNLFSSGSKITRRSVVASMHFPRSDRCALSRMWYDTGMSIHNTRPFHRCMALPSFFILNYRFSTWTRAFSIPDD